MASSIFVRDALYRISSQLHDISPQFTRWTERELVAWLNDGQKVIAKYMPHSCSRVDAIRLKPGTKQSVEFIAAGDVKPGDGSTATSVYGNMLQSVVRNMGTDGLTAGNSIRICDREVLDTNQPDWHTRPGTPVSLYTFDPRHPKIFYVYPAVPAGQTPWVEVSYLANPPEIANTGAYGMNGTNTTTISIDDKYIDDLVNYVLARAYMKDAEFADNGSLAQAAAGMFTSSINAQVAALTGVNPNLQSLPMNPNVPTPSR